MNCYLSSAMRDMFALRTETPFLNYRIIMKNDIALNQN